MFPRILARVFGWVKSHGRCSIEFEERGSEIWVIVKTWERSTFRRVCVAVLNRFSANTTLEATVLGKILDAAGPDTAVVLLHGGPHVLAEAFASYLGSGYQAKLVEYPTFDLRLWSSGMNMCCPITPSFLHFLMGSFWPGHGCCQLSTRLGVRTWSGNFNVMPVDFWKSLLPPCCRLWLPAQRLDRVWAVSVQRSSSGVTIMRHFICWVFCSMVC